MKPISGINRDVNPIDQPENTMRYAANGIISEQTGVAQSINNNLLFDSFAPGVYFLGWVLGSYYIYAFVYEGNTFDNTGKIYRIDPANPETKELIITDPDNILELDKEAGNGSPWEENRILQFVYQEDFESHDVIVWAGQAKPKLLDIGEVLEDAGHVSPTPVNLTDEGYTTNSFYLFPEGGMFNPDATALDTGGNVASGAWMFVYRYVSNDLATTNWSGVGNVVYITEESFDKTYSFQGDEGNRLTTKSILIDFIVDLKQVVETTRVQFGYISIRNRVTYAGILDSKGLADLYDPFNPENGQYLYTGEAPLIDLGDNILELITPRALYKHVGTITSLTSRLYAGRLTKEEDVNIQEIANNITSKWRLETGTSNRGLTLNRETFGAGECMALYISLLFDDGTESRAFHIPGRKYLASQASTPATTATGTWNISGLGQGNGDVGLTIGGTPFTVPGVNGISSDSAEQDIADLIALDPAYNTVKDANGVHVTSVATGLLANEPMLDATTDGGYSLTNVSGLSGGSNGTIAAGPDDPVVQDGYEKWQIWDTGNTDGTMGYWVNKSEYYPDLDEFNSARDSYAKYGNNVRHHKLPSLGWLLENGVIPGNTVAMPELSIELDNVDLSSLGERVIGYNIHYAKRRYGEIVNLAYDWPTPVGVAPGDATLYAIAGNFGYSDTVTGSPTALTDVIPSDKAMRFHALNLLTDFPSITPKYLVKELIIGPYPYTGFSAPSDEYTDLAGVETNLLNAYKYGITNYIYLGLGGFTPPEADRYIQIEDYAYVKNGVKYGFDGGLSLVNTCGEDAFVVTNTDGFNGPNLTDYIVNEIGAGGNQELDRPYSGNTGIRAVCALRAIPENISAPFDNQTLTFAKSFKRDVVTPLIGARYGDTYNTMFQFNTTGVCGMGPDPLSDPAGGTAVVFTTTDEAGMFKGEGSKIVQFGMTQIPINGAAQYAPGSDVQSYVAYLQGSIGYIGFEATVYDLDTEQKLKSWYFWDQDIYQSFTFYYSDDFHERSEYFIGSINDGYFIDVNTFPTMLAFSRQQFSNVPTRFWRNWPIGNNYVQPSEKGPIINLQGAGNQMLYIHHRYSLYTTKDRLTLEGTTEVTLGTSDIFQVVPYEIVSVDEGHTGIQNRHWQTLSPFGYSWIQTDHGKVYGHNGDKLEETSASGLRIFFRDTIRDDMEATDLSFSIINDDLRRRMLIGINYDPLDGQAGYTVAYSTTGGFWSFFHDDRNVLPILARDKEMFEFDGIQVNKVARGFGFKQFIIEAVFNDGTSAQKYLQYLTWNTNVYNWSIEEDREIRTDLPTRTFDTLVIYSDTKIYGKPNVSPGGTIWEFNLVPYVGFPKGDQNVRRLEDNWSTNSFRDLWDGSTEIPVPVVGKLGANPAAVDLAKDWHTKSRMRGKYFIVRLMKASSSNELIEFESLEFGSKPSFR